MGDLLQHSPHNEGEPGGKELVNATLNKDVDTELPDEAGTLNQLETLSNTPQVDKLRLRDYAPVAMGLMAVGLAIAAETMMAAKNDGVSDSRQEKAAKAAEARAAATGSRSDQAKARAARSDAQSHAAGKDVQTKWQDFDQNGTGLQGTVEGRGHSATAN